MKILFLVLTLLSTQAALACPLGKNEEHLTIQRVMRNFGRFTLKADSVATKGVVPFETVTDLEITAAIEDLGLAISCANAVIESPQGDLLPSHASTLTGEEQKNYILLFVKFMNEFEAALKNYQTIYQTLLSTPVASRSFKYAHEHSQQLEVFVDRAHKELFGN